MRGKQNEKINGYYVDFTSREMTTEVLFEDE